MTTLSMPVTATEIKEAFRVAKRKRVQYLEEHGWKLSSNFPDEAWRWCKIFKGREIAMSAGSAFALERSLT